MRKIKHFETTSGAITKVAYFDAYSIYDKLEGALFQVDVTDQGTIEVSIYDEHKDFFDSFNSDKWLDAATERANDYIQNDDYLGLVTLTKEGCEVVFDDTQDQVVAVEESKIGKFTTKRPFLNFIAGVKGAKIRLNSNVAYIDGTQLSGILDGTRFKFTIKENNTLDVEEIGTSKSDDAMIQRLLNDIDEIDVTGYTNKFVVSGLEFEDEKGSRYFLEVEHQKPIDKLKSLFAETETDISENASSFLDDLFASVDAKEEVETQEAEVETVEEVAEEVKVPALSYMEDSFRKINEEKVAELKNRIEEAEKNILRHNREIKQAERSISTETTRMGVLQTRLDTFEANEQATGYVFQVSDAKHKEREISESEMELVKDIAQAVGADASALAKVLSHNIFVIKLAKKDNFEDKAMTNEIFDRLRKIDVNGSVAPNKEGDFEYSGKMNWHQVVAKLIKKGFEQDPEFEKFAGSNSYEVEKPEDDIQAPIIIDGDNMVDLGGGVYGVLPTALPTDTLVDNKEANMGSTEFAQKKYRTYTEPTDLVILGTTDADDERDIEITDDFTSFEVRVNGKAVKNLESDGFVSILTVPEYKLWRKQMMKQGSLDGTADDSNFGVDAVLVQGFQGVLGVGVFSDELGYVTDFDESSYIHHDPKFEDDYPTVFLNFDDDVVIHDIPGHDLNKILSYVRDVTINKVLQ